jgi:cell wall-associated NlpC family hydrolase
MKVRNRILSFVLAMILLVSVIPVNAFAAGDIMYGIGFVTGSKVRVRKSADTNAAIVDNAAKGEVVVVVSKHGDWYKVVYDLKEGYMHGDYVDVSKTENAELGYGKITASSVNIRSGASTSSGKVNQAKKGEKAYIVGIKDGWYKVIFENTVGYVRSDYVELTEVPYENDASSKSPKFFKGGKSTGTAVSAAALGGSGNSGNSSSNKPASGNSSNNNNNNTSNNTSSSASTGILHGIGFVTGSGLRLRSSASTSGKTVDTASKNEVVVVVSKQGEWYKVIYNLQEGYMHEDYLKVSKTENAELGYGKVTASAVNVRSGAGASYGKVDQAKKGEKAYIIGINNGWYKVIFDKSIGYIRSDYLALTEVPYENKDSSKSPKFFRGGESTGVAPSAGALNGSSSGNSGSSSSGGSSSTTGQTTGDKIVAKAKQYLGVPYKWGGTDPSGFDCSGFVYYVLRSMGINVSRTQTAMYAQGTPVSKANLKPGDVVFFQNTYKAGLSHVGIYVGNGQFIHAPSSGKVVSYANLNTDYYIAHYYGAVRYAN